LGRERQFPDRTGVGVGISVGIGVGISVGIGIGISVRVSDGFEDGVGVGEPCLLTTQLPGLATLLGKCLQPAAHCLPQKQRL
jgi:hypothetical protein